MPEPDLRRFLRPQSIALVGASDDLTKFGGRCLRQLRHFGFAGRAYAINPKYDELQGLPCFASVSALPEAPDHVGVVVPAAHVLGVLEECAARGVPFATVFTAGFAETGTAKGRALQDEIAALCRRTGLRVMGPNCNGLINFVDGFALTSTATINGPRAAAGNVGIVSQSGGLGQVNTMWRAQQAGIGISYEVSCGNDSDLDVLDYARFMVEDEASDVVLILAERLSDGGKLARLGALAAEREKPIVMLKIGRTAQGAKAAASHTGAVTGSDSVHEAAFRQHGIIRVDDCAELYETAMLLRDRRRRPQGRRMAGMAISGGNAVLLTDQGAAVGLEWPDYTAETQQALAAWTPGYGTIANPTDLTTAVIGRDGAYRSVLDIITADGNVDVMVPILTFASRAEIEGVADLARKADKPVVTLWSGGCTDDAAIDPRFFAKAGLPWFRDTLPMLKAVRRAAGYAEFLRWWRGRMAPARPDGADVAAARATLGASGRILTEARSKAVLACYGLPVTREILAATAAEAVAVAAAIGGSVALKVQSPDIPHKTEAGGVRLGVEGAEAVALAFAAIVTSAAHHVPGARIEGVLVQEMLAPGIEMMLGVTHDPVFGPVVAVALGGIFVEVMADVTHRLAPVSAVEARDMLGELRGAKLLAGVRGQPASDVEALCDAIVRLSWLAFDLGTDIAEIDLNPVIVAPGQGRVRLADALIVRRS